MVNIFTIFIKYCENETIRYIFKNNYNNIYKKNNERKENNAKGN